jgi:hypothetical protein
MCLRVIDLCDVFGANMGSSSPPSPPQGPPFAARRPLYPSSTREDDTETRARARIETQNIYEIFTNEKPMSRAYVFFRARCNCRLTDHAFLSAGAGVSAREDIL